MSKSFSLPVINLNDWTIGEICEIANKASLDSLRNYIKSIEDINIGKYQFLTRRLYRILSKREQSQLNQLNKGGNVPNKKNKTQEKPGIKKQAKNLEFYSTLKTLNNNFFNASQELNDPEKTIECLEAIKNFVNKKN